VWSFLTAHQLPKTPFASGAAALAGRSLHTLLSKVPLYLPALGLGQPITLRAVEALADQHGIALASGEAWVVTEMIKRRDTVIADTYADAIAHASERGDRIIGMEDVRDTERFTMSWHDTEGQAHHFSGQPDVWVEFISAQGEVIACVLDYKTGRGESVGSAAENQQLGALATLGATMSQLLTPERRFHAVRGALIERATLGQPQITVFFPADVLAGNLEPIQDHVERQDRLLAAWRAASDSAGDPTPEFSAQLDAQARIGSQCTFCAGTVACGKKREWMIEKTAASRVSVEEEAQLARQLVLVEREQAELAGKPNEYFTEPMNEQTLKATHEAAKAMIEGMAVAESIHQATTDIIRHRLQKDAAAVPGFGLKTGARYLALNPERVTKREDGEDQVAQADLTPAGVFADLAAVLPGVAQERFVAEACEVNPGRVTELLGRIHGMPKDRVLTDSLTSAQVCSYIYKMSKLVPIKEAAKVMGVSTITMRRWDKAGLVKAERSASNRRLYDLAKLKPEQFRASSDERKTVAYARVSSHDQKEDLGRQKQVLELYCARQGWTFEVIADLGSGMNYHKKGLKRLLDDIIAGRVGRLVIAHKDRLLRFGAELVFAICEAKQVEVVILNQGEDTSFEQDLAKDVLEIITVFSARLYGSRSHKNQKLLDGVRQAVEAATAPSPTTP
jgi:predicted site-specific integrase-resolvase